MSIAHSEIGMITKPCSQDVHYPDSSTLDKVKKILSQLPPLVTHYEIENLKQQLAEAAQAKRFLLQGGDCAETFAECSSEKITNQLRILLQMSVILIHGLKKPVIRVGRIAGQYAKPRSQLTETQHDKTLPSYRGDIINDKKFNDKARIPDPYRMLTAYQHSAQTLNYLRALTNGGFADITHPELWNLDFAKNSTMAAEYQKIVSHIQSSLKFIEAISNEPDTLRRVDFFTSHEALLLPYEGSFTRQHENRKYYNLSCHLPWIGMRTAQLDHAHVDFFSKIANPIAVKVGPAATPDWLKQLIKILNPHNEPGRLTLITRFGVNKVKELLPKLIKAANSTGIGVLWSCDPMHGNTKTTAEGIKTRHFDDILQELHQTYQIHLQCNSHLGGVHFELTGENVTECTGGARGLKDADLKNAYKSLVDPRLNYEQALEMAMLLANTTP